MKTIKTGLNINARPITRNMINVAIAGAACSNSNIDLSILYRLILATPQLKTCRKNLLKLVRLL